MAHDDADLRQRMRLRLATPSARAERPTPGDAASGVGVITAVDPPEQQPAATHDAPVGSFEPTLAMMPPETLGPVVIPTIVAATPAPIAASVPVLAEPIPPSIPARPAHPPARPPAVAVARLAEPDGNKAATAVRRRRRRRPLRTLAVFLVVASILGGASYAGWYFFLRNQVTWAEDVQPLAGFVETTLRRRFSEDVRVETLSAPEYEVKLGLAVLDRSYPDPGGDLNALRAVGVAGPTTSPAAVGRIVASARTSFYEPATSTIYRLDGATPVFQFGLLRSLSVALIDQQIAWSNGFGDLTDAQKVGLATLVDGIANDVARARAGSDRVAEEIAAVELAGRLQAVGFSADQIPVYVRLAMMADFEGVSRYPVPPTDDPLAGLAVPPSDAVVFDLTRDPATPVGSTAPGERTLGMQFWYEALVPALGADAARDAALVWAGDVTTVSNTTGVACIAANILTADAAGQATISAAMIRLAQSRPASSAAVVTPQPGNVTSVSMCEPTEGATDALSDPSAMQLLGRANGEGLVARALLAAGLSDTRAAWNCAVLVRRGGALADYRPGPQDPTVVALIDDLVRFCSG